jgi:transducin (beta)-like 1
MEGRLENSPNFSKHIPRGELIDLLSKSLLYREVESHWKADHLALNCKAGFSLLEAHVCSLDPPKPKSVPLSLTYTQWPLGHSNRNGVTTDGKRKASPTFVDGPAEKRARRDADDMDTDCMRSAMRREYLVHSKNPVYRSSESSAKKPKPKLPRQPGPADSETNPNAILILPNETEVFLHLYKLC